MLDDRILLLFSFFVIWSISAKFFYLKIFFI